MIMKKEKIVCDQGVNMRTILFAFMLLISFGVFAQSYDGTLEQRQWQQKQHQNNQMDKYRLNALPEQQKNFLNPQHQNRQKKPHQEPIKEEEKYSPGLPIFDLNY
jgi:hypothetical protein